MAYITPLTMETHGKAAAIICNHSPGFHWQFVAPAYLQALFLTEVCGKETCKPPAEQDIYAVPAAQDIFAAQEITSVKSSQLRRIVSLRRISKIICP